MLLNMVFAVHMLSEKDENECGALGWTGCMLKEPRICSQAYEQELNLMNLSRKIPWCIS